MLYILEDNASTYRGTPIGIYVSAGNSFKTSLTIEAMKEANEMIRTGNFKRYTVDEAFETLKKDD